MQSLETIPAELVNKVVKQLHPFDLTRLARVSKYFLSFARDALWGNIELHRNYSHSSWLDDPWPKIGPFLEKYHLYYNWYHGQEQGYAEQCDCLNSNGKDRKFEKTNAIFHRVIKQLFQKAGKGKRWSEIAPYVRHLCMTINHLSAPYIWDAILSLPNLQSIQLVGEFEQPEGDNGPPEFRAPKHKAAQSICKIRFRGYIPQDFVASVITGSARSITHLDLGALLPPKVFEKEEDDKEGNPEGSSYLEYMTPRGVLWFSTVSPSPFIHLTHLLLCKRGMFNLPEEANWGNLSLDSFEVHDDLAYTMSELSQWASILQCVRATLVDLTIEQRPLVDDRLILPANTIPQPGMQLGEDFQLIPSHGPYEFEASFPSDSIFFHHLMEVVFQDVADWPKLKRLKFRGINFFDFKEDMGKTLEDWLAEKLPGVEIKQSSGDYMFFSHYNGTIRNEHSWDGLLPVLDLYGWLGSDGWL